MEYIFYSEKAINVYASFSVRSYGCIGNAFGRARGNKGYESLSPHTPLSNYHAAIGIILPSALSKVFTITSLAVRSMSIKCHMGVVLGPFDVCTEVV